MRDLQPRIHPQFLGRLQRLGRGPAAPAFGDKGGNRGVARLQRLGQRVIRADRGKGCAQQGIGAGRIDVEPFETHGRAHQIKAKLQPARLADPVGLHQPHLFRPVLQPVQRRQQFPGIIADLEEPLRQLAPFDQRIRPPAPPVDHLFIGQHRHIDRVPVDHRRLAVHQPRFHHVDEHRLLLAIIFRVAGRDFPAPVQRKAKGFQLPLHVGDVLMGPDRRVHPPFNRGILGRQAKGIPTHRMQHGIALRRLGPRHHIAHRIVAHMAHMDAPRRIGEHFQHVILGPRRIAPGHKDPGLIPGLLPLRFDHCGFVTRHHRPQFQSSARNYTGAGVKASLTACCPQSATGGRATV